MKKCLSIVIVILFTQNVAYAVRRSQKEERLRAQAEFLQEGTIPSLRDAARGAVRDAARGAVIGAGVGLGVAGYKTGRASGSQPLSSQQRKGGREIVKGSAVAGASLGFIAGMAKDEGLRRWQLYKIQLSISKYTILNFETLSQEQAMLMIAAYKRDISMMQELIKRQPLFVNKEGVWQALTEFFFN